MKRILLLAGLMCMSVLYTNAQAPKLKSKKIAEGVTASLPDNFYPMSNEDIAQRYPSTKKPLCMYTDMDRAVDFGLNESKSNWAGGDLKVLQQVYKSTILSLYKKVDFIQEGIKSIKKRDYICFEFTSEAQGNTKYTFLMYTVVNKKVFIFNFTCDQTQMKKWQETARAIMETVKINPKKVSKNVTEQVETDKKGGNSKQVLQEQKKHNPKKNK
ncbi:MAG: hypothetical protein ACJ75J_12160 [Cytophagaceae bacterium]